MKRKCFCLFLCNSFCSNFHYKLLVKFNQDGVIKNIVKILKSIIDKFMDFFFNKIPQNSTSIFFFSPNDQANKKTPSKSNGKRPSSADNNKTESSACVLQWTPLLFPWWYSINLHIEGHWNMNEILIFNLNNYGSVLKLSVIKRGRRR